MGKVLVDKDTVNELGVLDRAADLALHLDEVEVDIAALEIGDGQNGAPSATGSQLAVAVGMIHRF